MEQVKWTILGTILGGIIGIVGALLNNLFSIMNEKEKNKQDISRRIIEEKYNNFKKFYKKYIYSFAQLYSCNYTKALEKDTINKKVTKSLNEIYDKYMNLLSDIMDILDEDDYITKQLIDYDKLKQLYISIIGQRGEIFTKIWFWENYNELDKNKIQEIDKGFMELCKTMNEQLDGLYNNTQKILYKDIVKNC